MRTPNKLPQVGLTIFSHMSALATQHDAINLGQGFPDFACDPALPEAVAQAMRDGHNQYPPMAGVAGLRQAVVAKIATEHGHTYNWENEITITAGATQAILTALLALVQTGDEVVVLEPCYDAYLPSIALAGGVAVSVPLKPGSFAPDFAQIAAALTMRTRMLILNTPHNPSATVWSAEHMLALRDLLQSYPDVLILSDEVYEHMVFDGAKHQSVAHFPDLWAKSLLISSFGKSFHVTGWKIGYVAAPYALMQAFRKVHQFNVFTVNTPMQYGLAAYLQDPKPYQTLPAFYQAKRDFFSQGLAQTRLRLMPSAGTYFQCASYEALPDPERNLSEAAFCEWLTSEIGVAAIPLSVFYAQGFEQKTIRFCFAKKDDTLQRALEKLRRL